MFWRQDWLAIGLSFALLLAVDVALSSFWTCYVPAKQSSQPGQQQKSEEECSAFHGPLLTATRPMLVRIDHYGDAIIAVFTIVLAITSAALWHVSDTAATAAKRSADVAQAGLNPYLWPVIKGHILSQTGKTNALIKEVASRPLVQYWFENFGKSPALLKEIIVAIEHSPNPPTEPSAVKIALPTERVIAEGEHTGPMDSALRNLGAEIRKELKEQKTFIWFHGNVKFDDIFGASYVTEFCWKFDGRHCYFAPYDGDRKRNKCTRNT